MSRTFAAGHNIGPPTGHTANQRPSMTIIAAFPPPSNEEGSLAKVRRTILVLFVLTVIGVLSVYRQPFFDRWPPAIYVDLTHRGKSVDAQPPAGEAQVDTDRKPVALESLPDPDARKSGSASRKQLISDQGYIWPTTGVISQLFGCTDFELEPWNYELGCRFHYGIDIANVSGTPVLAATTGEVEFAGWQDDGYGYRVVLVDSDGVETLYGHLCCSPDAVLGQEVAQGEQIGSMGTTGASSGNHLHFAIIIGGIAVDPRAYLPGGEPEQ